MPVGVPLVFLEAPALVLGGGSVLLTAASRVVNSLECRGTTRRGSTVPPLLLLRYRCCYYVTSAAISLIMLLLLYCCCYCTVLDSPLSKGEQ